MSNFFLLLICLFLGIIFQKVKDFPDNAHLTLNNFIIYVSLPALSFLYIPELHLNIRMLYPVLTPYIIFFFGAILFVFLGKILNLPKGTVGCLILTAGLGNTSFIGYPVISMLYGDEGVKTAILVDQPGSFVVLSTFGIGIAAFFSSGAPSFKVIIKKVFTFPPFICFIIALLMRAFNFEHNEASKQIFQMLAGTVTPLALVSVGYQLKLNLASVNLKDLALGLSYKLLIAPFIIFFIFIILLGSSGNDLEISILQAAMAPMITASIISTNYGLNPRLASAMIGVGIPLSFVTLFLWHLII
jgi:malate permease and related proteins